MEPDQMIAGLEKLVEQTVDRKLPAMIWGLGDPVAAPVKEMKDAG